MRWPAYVIWEKIWSSRSGWAVLSREWSQAEGQGHAWYLFGTIGYTSNLKGLLDYLDLPCSSDGKESACNAGDPGSMPGWGRSPGEGNGNPLQYSCLENPMDRGAWRTTVQGVAESNMTEWLTLLHWSTVKTLTFTLKWEGNCRVLSTSVMWAEFYLNRTQFREYAQKDKDNYLLLQIDIPRP